MLILFHAAPARSDGKPVTHNQRSYSTRRYIFVLAGIWCTLKQWSTSRKLLQTTESKYKVLVCFHYQHRTIVYIIDLS